MQSGIAEITARALPRHFIDGVGYEATVAGLPAVEHLSRAIREQRVSDGYRRLLRAIVDEYWVPNRD